MSEPMFVVEERPIQPAESLSYYDTKRRLFEVVPTGTRLTRRSFVAASAAHTPDAMLSAILSIAPFEPFTAVMIAASIRGRIREEIAKRALQRSGWQGTRVGNLWEYTREVRRGTPTPASVMDAGLDDRDVSPAVLVYPRPDELTPELREALLSAVHGRRSSTKFYLTELLLSLMPGSSLQLLYPHYRKWGGGYGYVLVGSQETSFEYDERFRVLAGPPCAVWDKVNPWPNPFRNWSDP